MDQCPDAESILLRIGHKLESLSVWLEAPPEQWHVARPGLCLTPKPSQIVLNNVVEGDHSAVANQVTVVQVIAADTIVGVITIDEENVQSLAAKGALHGVADGNAMRVAVDEMDVQVVWGQPAEKRFVAHAQVKADQSRNG